MTEPEQRQQQPQQEEEEAAAAAAEDSDSACKERVYRIREELLQDLLGLVMEGARRSWSIHDNLLVLTTDNRFRWMHGAGDMDYIRARLRYILESLEDGFIDADTMSRLVRTIIADRDERDDFLIGITSLVEPTTVSAVPVEEWENEVPFAEWAASWELEEDPYESYEHYVASETSRIGPIQHSLRETLCLAPLRRLIWNKMKPEEHRFLPVIDDTSTTNTPNSHSSSFWNFINYLLYIHFVSGGRGIRRWTWINYTVYAALVIKHYIFGAFNILANLHSTMVGSDDNASGSNNIDGGGGEGKAQDDVGANNIRSISISDVREAWHFTLRTYFNNLDYEERLRMMVGLFVCEDDTIDGDAPLTRSQAIINTIIAKILDDQNINDEQASYVQTLERLRNARQFHDMGSYQRNYDLLRNYIVEKTNLFSLKQNNQRSSL